MCPAMMDLELLRGARMSLIGLVCVLLFVDGSELPCNLCFIVLRPSSAPRCLDPIIISRLVN